MAKGQKDLPGLRGAPLTVIKEIANQAVFYTEQFDVLSSLSKDLSKW